MAHLGRIVHIGCGTGDGIAEVVPQPFICGIDSHRQLANARQRYPQAMFLARDLEGPLVLPPELLKKSVVVCSEVIECLRRPQTLLETLARIMAVAPYVMLSTPDRTRHHGFGHLGPPRDAGRIREWSAEEFHTLLTRYGMAPRLFGHIAEGSAAGFKRSIASVHGAHVDYRAAPKRSCLAILSTYNDADIIPAVLEHLLEQDMHIHVMDNWSTDTTYSYLERMMREHSSRIVGLERFPAEGPAETFELRSILEHKVKVALKSQFDWCVHYESDELRESPWRDVSMRDAVSFIDACGYNSIDHTVVDFRPTQDGFSSADDPADFFDAFEFGRRSGHFLQVKGWKNTGRPVELAASGGHFVRFYGQRVYPLKFLLKHYPLRSSEQAQRKVFLERLPRKSAQETQIGWHSHYDAWANREAEAFLWQRHTLTHYDRDHFLHEFLLERLAGCGLMPNQGQ